MYGFAFSLWGFIIAVLATVIIGVSFSRSRWQYWIAVSCFTAIALGAGLITVSSILFSIGLGDAFGPGRASPLRLLLPLGLTFIYLFSVLSLFPFIPAKFGKKVVLGIVGLFLLFCLGSFVKSAFRQPSHNAEETAVLLTTIYYLLLWLRVHDFRVATDEEIKAIPPVTTK